VVPRSYQCFGIEHHRVSRTTDTAAKKIRIAILVTPVGRLNGSEHYVSRPPRVKHLRTDGHSLVSVPSLDKFYKSKSQEKHITLRRIFSDFPFYRTCQELAASAVEYSHVLGSDLARSRCNPFRRCGFGLDVAIAYSVRYGHANATFSAFSGCSDLIYLRTSAALKPKRKWPKFPRVVYFQHHPDQLAS
jgi:hypothetical protein